MPSMELDFLSTYFFFISISPFIQNLITDSHAEGTIGENAPTSFSKYLITHCKNENFIAPLRKSKGHCNIISLAQSVGIY